MPSERSRPLAAATPANRYVAPPYFAEALEIGKFVHDRRDDVMADLLQTSKVVNTLGNDLDKIFAWFLKQVGLDHLAGHL